MKGTVSSFYCVTPEMSKDLVFQVQGWKTSALAGHRILTASIARGKEKKKKLRGLFFCSIHYKIINKVFQINSVTLTCPFISHPRHPGTTDLVADGGWYQNGSQQSSDSLASSRKHIFCSYILLGLISI